jgi:1,4-dihydroxy-6-naphthoate synthase
MTTAATQQRTISLAHSPDSDDAFMFYGLATHKIDTGEFEFKHVLKDIQTLNEEARKGTYDVTAISFHAYAYVADKYALLPHGASIGDNYGPIVVAHDEVDSSRISDLTIAVPGKLTSAFLALSIFQPNFKYEVVPFDQIIQAVVDRKCDAGLLIHEGQLFYETHGLHKVIDLGEWWHEHTNGLPLPMGGNAIRRDLGDETIHEVSELLRESIRYSLDNREDALQYALQFARDMDPGLADRFVAMWVNDLTLDYSERGREGVRRLLAEGHAAGIIPHQVDLQFVT